MYIYALLVLISLVFPHVLLQDLQNDINVNYVNPDVEVVQDDDFEVVDPRMNIIEGSDNIEKAIKFLRLRKGNLRAKALSNSIFTYVIANDTFEGDVSHYEFSDLPSWLSLSRGGKMLEGVPSSQEFGDHHITFFAVSPDGLKVKNELLVTVIDRSSSSLNLDAGCHKNENILYLSIVIQCPNNSTAKVRSAKALADLFESDASKATISNKAFHSDLEENSLYSGGRGFLDSSFSTDHLKTFYLQLPIHCGLKSKEKVQKSLKQLKNSRNIADATIVRWFVNEIGSNNRIRRETEYSGDYSEDDYDYDYSDYFLVAPSGKSSTTVTPVFGDSSVQETPTSPVFKEVPLTTPTQIPMKPTKLVVLESSSVIPTEADFTLRPSDPNELESSLLTHPTTSADYTTPLTGISSAFNGGATRIMTESIEATAVPDGGSTSTEKSTEYIVRNFPPRIENRIQKIGWIAGSVYRMRIPEDTFIDFEDGNTRNLTLVLKDETGNVFGRDSWIQIDPTKQEVYALPLEKHIGRYDFRLEAIDKGRKSAIEFLEINVWQHNQARVFHHQFTAVLKLEKKYEYEFAYTLDWQVKAVEKIAALFQDTVSNINVRNITTNPVQISWTNVSLVNSISSDCPKEELEDITKVMLSGHGPEPTRTAKRVFSPEFQLKRIHSQFYDSCEKIFHHDVSDSGLHPFTPVDYPGFGTKHENTAPIFRNQIDQLSALVGHLYRFQVPDNTCYDMEDGNSRNLKMRILTIDLSPPSWESWLHFDSSNQEFYGIPLKEDIGRKEYLLECMDKGGESVSDALIIEVLEEETPHIPKPVLFSLTIDTPYNAFIKSPLDKVRLINRLGRAFGDPQPERNLALRSFQKGSVRVEWHNSSLPNNPCPNEEVKRLQNIMVDDLGRLRKEFKIVFLPDFHITEGKVLIPPGSCLSGDIPTYTEAADDFSSSPSEDEVGSPSPEDILLTFIIPAVIIALMLFIAALIACCLYRRRRYGKMRMTVGRDGDQRYISKGVPVIFAEELDDRRPERAARTPVVMKEEKPPLPPPEYHRATPPHSARSAQTDLDSSADETHPPYHRPPPFAAATNGTSRNQRSNPPPAYRKTPTYVPP